MNPLSPAEQLAEKLKSVGVTNAELAIIRNEDEIIPFIDESFEMDMQYQASEELTILTLNGEAVLTNGNLMTLVAPPGVGKSNIMEAICANGMHREADAFGFKVNLKSHLGILLIDTERTKNDIHRGYKRIYHRAKTFENSDQLEGFRYKKCRVHSYKVLDDVPKCIEHLEYHIASGLYQLILIDQVADFLRSVNKEEESKAFVRQLEIWATKYDIGILCTIHPNPKDITYKPTGHLGSALLKKSETVMACFKADADRNVRLITTDFEHGKVRNAYDVLESAFEWNNELKMFVSSDQETIDKAVSKTGNSWKRIDTAIYLAFTEQVSYMPNDLCIFLRANMVDTVKDKKDLDRINDKYLEQYAREKGIIELIGDRYFLSQDKMDEVDNEAPF